jgi:hypothetical protein
MIQLVANIHSSSLIRARKRKKGKKGQIFFLEFFIDACLYYFHLLVMLSDGIREVKQKAGQNLVQTLIPV